MVATEKVGLAQFPQADPESPLPAQWYEELLAKYKHADAIISFVGAPSLEESDVDQLPKRLPKLIAVTGLGAHVKKLLSEGVLNVAIVPRVPPSTSTQPPRARREWFDRYYTVLTPATVGSLPD